MMLPILGPWLVKLLAGRIGAKWAGRLVSLVSIVLIALALWFAASRAIGAIRQDARDDLLAEQAVARAEAEAAQRAAERAADDRRRRDLDVGNAADAAQHKELNDATKTMPDARPTPRQRARICRELQQQDAAASRPRRSC